MGDVSAPSNHTQISTSASSDLPERAQIAPDASSATVKGSAWRDAAYEAGTTPMAVWLQLRRDWPTSSGWDRPDNPRTIDRRYGVDPDFAAYVDATIADLAPEVD